MEHNSPTPFDKTRADHALESASDYVEMIDDLISETGEARAVDLASRMSVSHVTVSKTLQRLAREGYVTYRPYRSIFLTDHGRELACAARERHRLLFGLLTALGVPAEVAQLDSEGMEHHASDTTLAAIQRFLEEAAIKA